MYEIFIKDLEGNLIRWSVFGSFQVKILKMQMQALQGIPVDDQRLTFAGKQLEDSRTLSSYDVVNGSTLILMLRLVGGAGVKKSVVKKDKATKMLETERSLRSLQRQAVEATAGFQALVQSITNAVQTFKTNSSARLFDVVKRLSQESLERLNTSLQSNNTDHKVAVLAKEIFAPQYKDILLAGQEIDSIKQFLLLSVMEVFDRDYVSEQGTYDMQSYGKTIMKAIKGDDMEDRSCHIH